MDMRDVARLAGVSSATVSRVINGSPRVRPETAERVRRIIAELKFYPNTNAAALKWGNSGTLGVIVPDITNPFFSEFIQHFERAVVDLNLEMLMVTNQLDLTHLQGAMRRMLVRRVTGVALLGSEIETESVEALLLNRTPLVTSDRRTVGVGLSDVSNDYLPGMMEAVAYLKEMGHKQIGFIAGSAHIKTTAYRTQAFVDAIRLNDMRLDPECIVEGDYRIPGGMAGMRQLLEHKRRPTAVMAANDLTAIGALRMAHQQGLEVPRDLSIIGFDDTDFCEILHPPLTSIQLSRKEYANTFCQALVDAAREPDSQGQQYCVGTSLVLRASSGPAPKAAATKR